MAIVNKQVVQRSWALFELAATNPEFVFPPELAGIEATLGLSYGRTFKYEEFMVLSSRFQALLVVVFLYTVAFTMAIFPPVGTASLVVYMTGLLIAITQRHDGLLAN